MLEYRVALYQLHPEPDRTSNLTPKMIFLDQAYHVKWFSGQNKNLNTRRECEPAANQAKSENLAEPVPGPDQTNKISNCLSKKI